MIERPLALDYRSGFRASWTALRRAAEAMRTTQAAVSLKLKRLEEARLPARRAHASLCALDGARRELPLRAHPRRSRCLMLRLKPDVASGSGLRLLETIIELGKLLRRRKIVTQSGRRS